MARTGRFGRLPRAAPDLSGAIAALLREAQAQYDANMVDAWKSGGQVDGKPVDDSRLLAHFKARRDALSKDDPLWDEWNNRVQQYTFSIEESKMSLKWDQKKATEADMRAFYLKWAKTATPNSEFKRHLESQAAKWVTTAKAGGGGGGGRKGSSADAHAKAQQSYYDRHVKTGHYVNDYLIQVAKLYEAMPVNGNGLEDLNPNSAGYTKFLDIYLDGKTNDPRIQQILDSGLSEIRKFDPTFTWDKANIDRELREAEAGSKHLMDTSTTKTERNGWEDINVAVTNSQNRIQDAPVAKQMFDAAEKFETRLKNCQGDPYCARNAMIDLRSQLQKRADELISQGINDVNVEVTAPLISTITYLDNAIAGRETDTTKSQGRDRTIFELMQGTGTGQVGDTLDNGSWIVNVGNGVAQQIDLLRQGGWIGSQPIMDGNMPRRDSEGNFVWEVVVHSEGDLPPIDAVLIEGSGALEGGPVVVPFYATPTPVEVMVTAPDGTPTNQGIPALPDAEGNLTPVDPMQTSSHLWDEITGVIGLDGVARTLYRTGDGSPERPYLFHTKAPTITDGEGNAISPSRDPETNAKVFPVRSQIAIDAEGKPALVFDYTPYVEPAKAERTPLGSGLRTWGTYQTASGANSAATIDDIYDRARASSRPNALTAAREEAEAHVARFTKAAAVAQAGINADIAAGRTPDPAAVAAAEALKADAVQVHKTNAAYVQGVTGQTYNDYWNHIWSTQKDPGTLAREAALRAAGITAARYGQAEVDRRSWLLGQLETYEEEVAATPIPGTILDVIGRTINRATGEPDTTRATRADLRKSILDPTVGASQIKLPGADGVMPGRKNMSPIDFMLSSLVAATGYASADQRRELAQATAEPVWGPPSLAQGDPLNETPFSAPRPSGIPDRRRITGAGFGGRRTPGVAPTGVLGPPRLGPPIFAAPPTPVLPSPVRKPPSEDEMMDVPVNIPLPPPPIPTIGRDIKPAHPVTRPF